MGRVIFISSGALTWRWRGTRYAAKLFPKGLCRGALFVFLRYPDKGRAGFWIIFPRRIVVSWPNA